MAFLVVAVVIVGCVSVLNVLLLSAVIRRLREHNDAITRLQTFAPGFTLAVGTRVGDFAATTIADEPVTRDALTAEESLVAFFSARCDSCREHLPSFVQYAKSSGGPDRVLAVIAEGDGPTEDLIEALRPVAQVVLEPEQGTLAALFGVGGFPSFFTLDRRGRVTAAAPVVDDLPAADPAIA